MHKRYIEESAEAEDMLREKSNDEQRREPGTANMTLAIELPESVYEFFETYAASRGEEVEKVIEREVKQSCAALIDALDPDTLAMLCLRS